ncbi:MAG: hypothetical protein KBD06_02015 [Candidatus Pacebacteria bacterium]|nr:hypothetical protein [Candidatus Paceibacterota bacterium]
MHKQSIFTALWYIVSGIVAGMIVSVVLPQMFTIRHHPLHVLLICMIIGSFIGFVFSCNAKK